MKWTVYARALLYPCSSIVNSFLHRVNHIQSTLQIETLSSHPARTQPMAQNNKSDLNGVFCVSHFN